MKKPMRTKSSQSTPEPEADGAGRVAVIELAQAGAQLGPDGLEGLERQDGLVGHRTSLAASAGQPQGWPPITGLAAR